MKLLGRLVSIGFLLLLAVVVGWNLARSRGGEPAPPAGPPAIEAAAAPATPSAPLQPVTVEPPPVVQALSDCAAPAFDSAAALNTASIDSLTWAPFRGRAEIGWRTYGPRIAEEIGSDCTFDSPGFAQALSRWQADHRLAANGQLIPDTFQRMRTGWDLERPFQRAARNGCPPAAAIADLQEITPAERFGGKATLVHPGALAAYRRMVADAKAARVVPDPALLTVFSAYRDPAADADRCARDGDCGGASRALCSAHRTGTALDLNLGHAPGSRPDSSEDNNRRWMSQTPTYCWLVRNGPRYGFVNYAFEPWHWEWAGAAP